MMDPESPLKAPPNVFNFNNLGSNSGEDPWFQSHSNIPQQQSENAGDFGNYGGYNIAQNNNSQPVYNNYATSLGEDDYENEPPLLEELGIRFDHIWNKTKAVMYPIKPLSENILEDADLAGPLCFCLLFGACLLLSGKVQFGYIYGFSVFGCLGMNSVLNLMHPVGLDFWRTCSVLGYCLIPVIGLAAISIVLSLKGWLGLIFAVAAITWATSSATRMFEAKLGLTDQYWLVAYPIMLMYSCFVLITIF